MSTAKKGRIDINAELKEGMIASFIKEKHVEMSTVAMTMTKSISHINTDRKAFAVRRVRASMMRQKGFHCRGAEKQRQLQRQQQH